MNSAELAITLIPSHIICALSGSLTLLISFRIPTVATSILSSKASSYSWFPPIPSFPPAYSVLTPHPLNLSPFLATFEASKAAVWLGKVNNWSKSRQRFGVVTLQ